ncbi:1819_t:CDS:2 [Acaulospora morrowiae]|uniref:Fructose-bisphosphate aldolase n=1 Tax=Acaulospora morrowiae TaxID=94023 RepID=A0A9N9HTX5_9GLOM|nr:1819_t:CDS:2 [Acaulospora morrowiae]
MGVFELGIPTGVITGEHVRKLFNYAKSEGFAIPAVNVSSSSTINAVLEAARDIKAPIIIQLSQGGSAFYAGKGISNENQRASIKGSISAAHHIRLLAKEYEVPVVLHSDHCAEKLLPWFDGMLEADEEYFAKHGEPLFSSHMLDLSELPRDRNIEICEKYLTRMSKINLLLEMEIGITGGEEDGVNNTDIDNASLYTQPEDIYEVYRRLSKISDLFTIAAAFGNVHGVYKPGNVKLTPILLKKHQDYIKDQLKCKDDKPVWLVFHGGSGSVKNEIREAVGYGVIKMNVDTDTQWAYWEGIKNFYESKKGYLQSQVGNPEGEDKPNKKYYDPRVFIREAEKSMIKRVKEACEDLGNVNRL